jgi:hypothetical protein
MPNSVIEGNAVDDIVEDFLQHYGVLGMRWGHRKSTSSTPATKRDLRRAKSDKFAREEVRIGSTHQSYKDARRDAKWLRATHGANLAIGRYHGKTTQKIVDEATKKMKPEIKALKKKPEYSTRQAKKEIRKNKNAYHPNPTKYPIAAKYHKDVSNIYMKNIKLAAPNHMQVSPSGKWEDHLSIGKDYWYVGFQRTNSVKHAAMDNPDIAVVIKPVFDNDGYIIDFELLAGGEDDSIAQSSIDNLVEEILEHHGVKGMRWGHRKEQVTAAVSSRVPHLTDQQKSTAKKIAIGVGTAAVVVGGAYVAYKLNQSGKIALPLQSRNPAKIDKLLSEHGTVRLNRKEYQRMTSRSQNKFLQLNLIKALRLREKSQGSQISRTKDREQFIKLMMSSKKHAPTLEEATRIAEKAYPPYANA